MTKHALNVSVFKMLKSAAIPAEEQKEGEWRQHPHLHVPHTPSAPLKHALVCAPVPLRLCSLTDELREVRAV